MNGALNIRANHPRNTRACPTLLRVARLEHLDACSDPTAMPLQVFLRPAGAQGQLLVRGIRC